MNFLYLHLNRLIVQHDLNMINIIGPGHGGPGLVANTDLEGSYTGRYPAIERSLSGMHRLFRQSSWPGGILSHVAPETPGSIYEGGRKALRCRFIVKVMSPIASAGFAQPC